MLDDIVIDTNVFVHSTQKSVPEFQSSCTFLLHVFASSILLKVDKGGLIEAEYKKHLRFGSIGNLLVTHLASSKRVVGVDVHSDAGLKSAVVQLISNVRDRTFLLVCFHSDDRVFVSHDFDDFGISKRKIIKRKYKTKIIKAIEAIDLVS